jgi:hypothetical protein
MDRPSPASINRRKLATWEIVGGIAILFGASFLHFLYELSGFAAPAAIFGSVNESTWEHLKIFFWPGLAYAIVQHAWLRHEVNNFWVAKATSLVLMTVGIIVAFYFYLGIALPLYGRGALWADIGTGIVGIALGQFVSYRLLTAPPLRAFARPVAVGVIGIMTAAVILFTFAPPRFFLFENFYGYRYTGEFGILEDYEPYLVFR